MDRLGSFARALVMRAIATCGLAGPDPRLGCHARIGQRSPEGAPRGMSHELFVDATVLLDKEARRQGSMKMRPEGWWLPDFGR
jgi:hypothetical protein